jgi:hypothetical protein
MADGIGQTIIDCLLSDPYLTGEQITLRQFCAAPIFYVVLERLMMPSSRDFNRVTSAFFCG